MPKLYIIQGFLGAGKTTFSRRLAVETNSIILNPDEIVVHMFDKNEYLLNWGSCFEKAVKKAWDMASIYLEMGQDVIFDMGFWDKKSRDNAKSFAQKHNAEPIHYYIYAPDEILKERISQRQGVIAKSNLENFDKIKVRFEEPTKEENAIIINNF